MGVRRVVSFPQLVSSSPATWCESLQPAVSVDVAIAAATTTTTTPATVIPVLVSIADMSALRKEVHVHVSYYHRYSIGVHSLND
jgi:hypothetical protein